MLVRGAGFDSVLGEVASTTLDSFFARERTARAGAGESAETAIEREESAGESEKEERAREPSDSEGLRERVRTEPALSVPVHGRKPARFAADSQRLGERERGDCEGAAEGSRSNVRNSAICRRSVGIALLKVDTEGMDGRVLRGARRLLECRAIQVCLCGGRGDVS